MSIQTQTMAFLRQYIEKYNRAPTVKEVMEGMGLPSTSMAHYRLTCLRAAGMVDWDAGKARTLRLVPQADA